MKRDFAVCLVICWTALLCGVQAQDHSESSGDQEDIENVVSLLGEEQFFPKNSRENEKLPDTGEEISPCDSNPCDVSTTECIKIDATDFYCKCKDGYRLQPEKEEKTNKEKCLEISPCDSNPCDASTTECIKIDATDFYCKCKDGYRLQTEKEEKTNKEKCLEISPCDSNSCDASTTECIKIDTTDFYCKCKAGYRLQPEKEEKTNKEKCLKISPCDSNPCDASTTECIKIDTTNFYCKCKDGYGLQPEKEEKTNKEKCLEISPCDSNPCDSSTTECIKKDSTDFYCKCKDGYKLQPGKEENANKDKCLAKKPCEDNPCDAGTTQCIAKGATDYYCRCKDGYKLQPGKDEKTNKDKCLDPCSDITCEHDGKCKVVGKDYKCVCSPLYKGKRCETATCNGTPCKNGGICRLNEKLNTATCECPDSYDDGATCETPKWCKEHKICKDEKCGLVNNHTTGHCFCRDKDKYFDFEKKECHKIPECVSKGCKKNQICNRINGNCDCLDGFTADDENKMCNRTNICETNTCFYGGECSETDIANVVKCSCKSPQFYTGKECEDLTCLLRSLKKNCKADCPKDMERKENGECKQDTKVTCKTKCGDYGYCYKDTEDKEVCVCENHDYINEEEEGKCVLKKEVCPGGKLTKDKLKCDCKGKFKYASNKVTCERKTCSEKDVQEECQKLGAICDDDWHNEDGYKCNCPTGYAKGADGKCTDVCNTLEKKKECAESNKFCFLNEEGKADCMCPPGFTGSNCEGSFKDKSTYIITDLPVLKEKYVLTGGIVDFTKLTIEVIAAMKETFQNLVFARLYSYKVSNDIVSCAVWLQFIGEAGTDYRRIKYQARTFGKENILPPSLLLKADKLKDVKEKEMSMCAGLDNDPLCDGMKCENEDCSCQKGFEIIESSFRKYGTKEFYKCQDIDECAKGIDNCPANTICENTKGSFYCKCAPGFKLKNNATLERENKEACIGACEPPNPCNKGTCKLNELNMVDCSCPAGSGGSYCDRKDLNFAGASKKTVVVGAILGTLLGVIVIIMVVYVLKQKKNSYSEDFTPAPRIDNAEMLERRPVRGGVSNRAYQ